MEMQQQHPLVEWLIGQFKRGAIVTHFGYQDENDAMQTAGIAGAKEAVEILDDLGSDPRSALIPLLEDPDWSVRVFAAIYLKKTHPLQALAALNDIRSRCPTNAQWTAVRALGDFESGEPPP